MVGDRRKVQGEIVEAFIVFVDIRCRPGGNKARDILVLPLVALSLNG